MSKVIRIIHRALTQIHTFLERMQRKGVDLTARASSLANINLLNLFFMQYQKRDESELTASMRQFNASTWKM